MSAFHYERLSSRFDALEAAARDILARPTGSEQERCDWLRDLMADLSQLVGELTVEDVDAAQVQGLLQRALVVRQLAARMLAIGGAQ